MFRVAVSLFHSFGPVLYSAAYFLRTNKLFRFFQFLITYIGVFFDEREGSILNPFRPLSNFIFAIIGPPMWFTDHMMPRIRFGYQYAIKAARRMRSKEPAFKASEPYKPRYDYQVPNPKLIEVLNIEHILLEVIENSHYEDIINFSLASRAVREAVFPGGDLELRVPKLKKHCCNKESKVGCFYCNKKVCLVSINIDQCSISLTLLFFYSYVRGTEVSPGRNLFPCSEPLLVDHCIIRSAQTAELLCATSKKDLLTSNRNVKNRNSGPVSRPVAT
jgi:hypothetical protein